MSRDYGKIKKALWGSQKFRSLKNNDRAKLLYFYFHTAPHINSIGCYRVTLGYMASDIGWGEEQVVQAIEDLSAVGLIRWNPNEEIVKIVKFISEDPPCNEKHAGLMVREAFQLPDCEEKLHVFRRLSKERHAALIATVSAEIERLSLAYGMVSDTNEKGIARVFALNLTLNPTLNPILPEADASEPNRSSEAKSRGRQPYSEQFEEFWRAYPTDPNMSKKKTYEVWKRLSPEDWSAAIAAVPAFRRYCADNAKSGYRPVYAERFLSERRFDGFNAPPPASTAVEFNDTDERGWKDRLKAFHEKRLWSPRWGGKPGESDCRVPKHLLEHAA